VAEIAAEKIAKLAKFSYAAFTKNCKSCKISNVHTAVASSKIAELAKIEPCNNCGSYKVLSFLIVLKNSVTMRVCSTSSKMAVNPVPTWVYNVL